MTAPLREITRVVSRRRGFSFVKLACGHDARLSDLRLWEGNAINRGSLHGEPFKRSARCRTCGVIASHTAPKKRTHCICNRTLSDALDRAKRPIRICRSCAYIPRYCKCSDLPEPEEVLS